MKTVYSFIVQIYGLAVRIAALFGNSKAKYWVEGRRNWRRNLKNKIGSVSKPTVWIHASSTGEFEQGRTVIERLRKQHKEHYFVLTFFSPSGFRLHSNYSKVDAVFYLPLDSRNNARDFLEIVNPKAAIFIKYEFWYHYFEGIAKRDIPLFLVSAKLTKDHMFFKWYGRYYRKVLRLPTLFFVQDESTHSLLKKLDVDNTMITGDTRIDRVLEVLSTNRANSIVGAFLKNEKAVIVGSSWETENSMIERLLNTGAYSGKVILAPHEIDESAIEQLRNNLKVKSVRYTHIELESAKPEGQILIVDCVGVLKELYRYGSWAFIGGGFSDGIHNILEPAVFGLPVVFGPKYKKFSEAVDLIEQGGAEVVTNYNEFFEASTKLMNEEELQNRSTICSTYIQNNRGATEKVVDHINQYL